MSKKVIRSVAPIYAVGVTWLVWALFLPLYAPLHFAAVAVASAVVFVLARKIWPDRSFTAPEEEKETPKTEPKTAKEETKKEEPLSPEITQLLAERDRALGEMRRLNDSIADEKISARIDHLELVTGKIIDHVAQNPTKLPQIRRFLNYYLPTTLKLLNAYDRMDSAGVSGANIDGTKGRVENIMDTIVKSFDQQLDALFGDEALDISTDITVLEQMLAREGLGGTQMPG